MLGRWALCGHPGIIHVGHRVSLERPLTLHATWNCPFSMNFSHTLFSSIRNYGLIFHRWEGWYQWPQVTQSTATENTEEKQSKVWDKPAVTKGNICELLDGCFFIVLAAMGSRKSPGMEARFSRSLATSPLHPTPRISGSHPFSSMPPARIIKASELLAWDWWNRFLAPSPIPLHRLPPERDAEAQVSSLLEVLPNCPWNPSALAGLMPSWYGRWPPLSLYSSGDVLSSSSLGYQGLARETRTSSKKPDCIPKVGLSAPLITHHSNLHLASSMTLLVSVSPRARKEAVAVNSAPGLTPFLVSGEWSRND